MKVFLSAGHGGSDPGAVAKGVLKTLGVEYKAERGTLYRVQVGAYLYRENAEATMKKIKAVGFDAFIVKE